MKKKIKAWWRNLFFDKNSRPENYERCKMIIPPAQIDAELRKAILEMNGILIKHKKTAKQLDKMDASIRRLRALKKFYITDGLMRDKKC